MESKELSITFHNLDDNTLWGGFSNEWVDEYPDALIIDPEEFDDESEDEDDVESMVNERVAETLITIFKSDKTIKGVAVICGFAYQSETCNIITRKDFDEGVSVYN